MNTAKRPLNNITSLASAIRGRSHAFIERRLREEGITGLAPSHGNILAMLYAHGPQSMAQLSAGIKRDKSTTTVLVRKLAELQYITKEQSPQDSRVSVVRLTTKGEAFQPVFTAISQELEQKIWGNTAAEERDILCQQLEAIIERL